jgi:linoleoyl-CoA desaturase
VRIYSPSQPTRAGALVDRRAASVDASRTTAAAGARRVELGAAWPEGWANPSPSLALDVEERGRKVGSWSPRLVEVEALLREFRRAEMRNRQRPTTAAYFTDAASRLVLLVIGYLGSLVLPLWLALPACALMAISTVSLIGSYFHDGVHQGRRASLSVAGVLKRIAAAPVALSPRWWEYKHLRLHHVRPGDPLFDPDIQFGVVGRVSAAQAWRPMHRTQHLHMWLLVPLATLNMLRPTELWTTVRFRSQLGDFVPKPHVFLVDRYPAMMLFWLPVFLVRPMPEALASFVVFHLVAGTLVSLTTQVQHNTDLVQPLDATDFRTPLVEQVFRSSDVPSRGLWWWISGGTNYHALHHLVPALSFLELPGATERLRAVLRDQGYDVPTHSSLRCAVRAHGRLVRSLSRPVPNVRPSRGPR